MVDELCNQVKAYINRMGWTLQSFVLEYTQQLHLCTSTMSSKVKTEPEEEVRPGTSGGDVWPEQQPGTVMKEPGETSESEETMDSDEIDDEYLTNYCETVDSIQPMTVSKELFYTDSMVARNYERLSPEDKKRFDQMKELAESIKQETGDYSLIEDLMARIIGERFGSMKEEDVRAVMGKQGEGSEGGKHVKQEGSRLTIKSEPGAKAEKVVISAIVPAEEPTLILYCVKADEEEDCETIGTDSDVEEINKEVQGILKELAGLRRKEAECFDRLTKAIPDMQDNEVVIVAEKIRGTELPQCVYQMSRWFENPRDFRAVLAAGERLYSMYKYQQAGTLPMSIPELCANFDIGKTKIYELLRGEKYRYPPKEEAEKKPARRIQPEKVEAKEPPTKKTKRVKAVPT